ncbi:hypothetical protein [Poseidonocella sp. HB161398]|uniref:hypothetical protein n=1 Tax=Poseidonocella sp. HB161398 TaxID=2320855 RepID=UPI001108C2AF|nr:hypothetical protein [Poseidonocella sp. HB161398]
MPDLDTGHLFLTFLVPVLPGGPKLGQAEVEAGNHVVSYEQRLRIALSMLPTARQSPATEKAEQQSPFAANLRNHFVRMFVLEDVVYNGRNGEDALVSTVRDVDTINPLPVDRLNCRYLVFTADIDAVAEDGAPLPATLSEPEQAAVRAAYAHLLWETMEPDLRKIFNNCREFEGMVETAPQFAAYLERCHVETTMPFHDYYLSLPAFNVLPLKALIAAVAVPGAVALLALVLRLLGMGSLFGIDLLLLFAIALVLTGVAGLAALRFTLANGARPLPPSGTADDLPSVLKSLYLQQAFSKFAVETQGASPEELHAAFGRFLDQHAPGDTAGPTQPPGVISFAHAQKTATA